MKIISCFNSAHSGEVLVNGNSVQKDPLKIKKQLGYLAENNPLYEEMYVKEFLLFVAKIHQLNNPQDAVDDVIEKVGLTPEKGKKIGQLSKGYQQRVGIAQAIIHDPDVLILDEPTSGLDPLQLDEIRTLIKTLGKNKTVLLSTHIMQEVESICDRIIVIKKGEIVADQGIKDDLNRSDEQVIVVEFDQEPKEEKLIAFLGEKTKIKKKGSSWVIASKENKDLRREIASFAKEHSLLILELKKESAKLEDLFKKLTK
ncbi:MAG: gliding motility-associated ABC transporter ATP-binding subunit GldA [Crocinitomicaceae bacterium]|nr:MAG: gliding motility-associated ABC transporter ATP-binding subunit GldA [Crocinitomicaceae bacterium]